MPVYLYCASSRDISPISQCLGRLFIGFVAVVYLLFSPVHIRWHPSIDILRLFNVLHARVEFKESWIAVRMCVRDGASAANEKSWKECTSILWTFAVLRESMRLLSSGHQCIGFRRYKIVILTIIILVLLHGWVDIWQVQQNASVAVLLQTVQLCRW